MTTRSDRFVDDYFAGSKSWAAPNSNCRLNYVGYRHGEKIQLLKARLFLNPAKWMHREFAHSTGPIVARSLGVAEFKCSPSEIIKQILNRSFVSPDGLIDVFELDVADIELQMLHSVGLAVGQRLAVLTIKGNSYPNIDPRHVDWVLKAGSIPYESIEDLAIDFELSPANVHFPSIEIIAHNVARISPESIIDGTSAKIVVQIQPDLDPKLFSIGVRVGEKSKIVERKVVTPEEIKWDDGAALRMGTVNMRVAEGTVLHCIAVYNGAAQHQWWVVDPKIFQNSNRMLCESVDTNLQILNDLLFETERKGRNAREFETGVALLLWILGFSVAHFGVIPRLQEGPDLIARTQSGNVLAVECTTGLLKANNKLAVLISRTGAIEKSLRISGSHAKVRPVIVTALEASQIQLEMEDAQRHGVAVVTREDLRRALDSSLLDGSADRYFAELEVAIDEGLRRHKKAPG